MNNIRYRDKDIETIDRAQLEKLQLKGLKNSVGYALRTPFYKARLEKAGIRSPDDIRTLADISKIPFTTKADLRQSYTRGLLAVDIKDVVRLHTSSGTTGVPTVIYHTRSDLENWSELIARSIVATGASETDVLQNMMTYGLFTGGLGLHYGAERLGMLVIPSSSGNTRRQMMLLKDFASTVVHATPSYMLHMHSKIEEYEYKLSDFNMKKTYMGGEPYSENTRLKIEEMYGIDAYNSYGLSEMNGPGVAFECTAKDGMHLWEDSYYMEVIDPHTGAPVRDGEEGEIVLTCLQRQATPILRYRTKDLASVYTAPCPCGRTHRRISRISGRTDDMLIINGANVFPSQIEQVIMNVPEVGTNYQIHLTKDNSLDRLTVRVEIYSKLFHGEISELENLKRKIHDELKASILINAKVELHEPGSLPAFELKAKRVVDERTKI